MPIKGYLNKEQKQKLQNALIQESHPEKRQKILRLLQLNDGINNR